MVVACSENQVYPIIFSLENKVYCYRSRANFLDTIYLGKNYIFLIINAKAKQEERRRYAKPTKRPVIVDSKRSCRQLPNCDVSTNSKQECKANRMTSQYGLIRNQL